MLLSRFVEGYPKLAWPLTELLKCEGFHWNENAKAAFYQLKAAMTKVPVLALLDFSLEFVIDILIQNQHPIAYFSQALP